MRTVVLGAGGQYGAEVVRRLSGRDLEAFDRAALDIGDAARLREVLLRMRPEVVVNAAAFTSVDACEDEPERAFWINAQAVRHLAQACAEIDALLVHMSTDYVFDGSKGRPYDEDDPPGPLSVYGTSKLAGEYFVRAIAPRWLIVRTSGVYGLAGAATPRGNFVETMLRLADDGRPVRVVADQVLVPTAASDLARAVVALVDRGRHGLVHVTNGGACSWFEFASTIFRLAGLAPELRPVTSREFGARARRPAYSVLGRRRLAAAGLDDLPPWRDALAGYLAGRGRLAAPGPVQPARAAGRATDEAPA
jgi:dTDP-4-dehydrorhamnose reductase